MAMQIADRVKETTTTTGTGALALAGAATGFRAFSSVCSVSDTCYYAIQAVDANGNPTGDWEVGVGTYSAAATLTRTSVLSSSNAGAAVSLAAGTKQVWIDVPAAQIAALAKNGANSDITSLAGLTTALSIGQGGTGQTTQAAALSALLGASLIPVANGGTNAATAATARTNLGAAASGTNGDITSLTVLTAISNRPTFNGKIPWDTGNRTNPANCTSGNGLNFDWSAHTSGQIGVTIDVSYQGYLWHSGNFNPSNYAPLAGASFSGTVSFSSTANFYGSSVLNYTQFGYINSAGPGVYSGGANAVAVGIYASNAIIGSQVWAPSDRRLKKQFEEIAAQHAIDFVNSVTPYRYLKEGVIERGFVAQDVGKAWEGKGTELLTCTERKGLPEQIDEDGFVSPADHVLNISYDQIIPIHASVLRDLLRRVATLEDAIKRR